jgi:hypothetical protein
MRLLSAHSDIDFNSAANVKTARAHRHIINSLSSIELNLHLRFLIALATLLLAVGLSAH